MAQFVSLIFMAIIVEGLITYTKTLFVDGKPQWQMLVGIVLGITVALVYNVDVFALLGIVAAVPYVGAILTGILISRGSNYIFDLIKALQGAGSGVPAETITQGSAELISSVKATAPANSSRTSAAVAVNNSTAANPPTDDTAA